MKKSIFCIITCLFVFCGFAQETSTAKPPVLPRFAVRANLGVPKIVSSQKYRNSFSGVFAGEIGVSYKLFSTFNIGVGYNYNYFKAQRYFRENVNPKLNASMQMQGGFVKLGYDHFFSPKGFTTISLNVGYQTGKFYGLDYPVRDTIRAPFNPTFANAYVEPMIGVYFIVDPNFAFGAHLSYSYNFQQFNAENIGFNSFGFSKTNDKAAYNNLHNSWGMSMITIGFGFYYGLARK